MKLITKVIVAVARKSARTGGTRQMLRTPMRTSSATDVVAGGGCADSRFSMRPTRKAETTNDAASTAIAKGAVSHATSAPPRAGPEISAMASTASRLPFASSRRLRPTRSVM